MVNDNDWTEKPLNVFFPYEEGTEPLESQLRSLQQVPQKEHLFDSLMILVDRVDEYALADLECLLSFIKIHSAQLLPSAQNFFFFIIDAARRMDANGPVVVRLLLDFMQKQDLSDEYSSWEEHLGLVRETAVRQDKYSLSITLLLIQFFRYHISSSSLALKELADSIPYLLAAPPDPEVDEVLGYLLTLMSTKEDFLSVFSSHPTVTKCSSEELYGSDEDDFEVMNIRPEQGAVRSGDEGISWQVLIRAAEKLISRTDNNASLALSALLDSMQFPIEFQAAFTIHEISYYYDSETRGNYPLFSSNDHEIQKIQRVYARFIAILVQREDEPGKVMLSHVMEHIGVYPLDNADAIRGLSILLCAMKCIVSQQDDEHAEQNIQRLMSMIHNFSMERKIVFCQQEKWVEWFFSLIGEFPEYPKVVNCLWEFIQSLSQGAKIAWKKQIHLPNIILFTAWVPPREGLPKEGFRHRWSSPLLRMAVLKRLLDFVRFFRTDILEEILHILPLQDWKKELSEWNAIIEYESKKNLKYASLSKLVFHLLRTFWPQEKPCRLLFHLIKHQNLAEKKAFFHVVSPIEPEYFSVDYIQWFNFCMNELQIPFQEAVSNVFASDEHLCFITALIQSPLTLMGVNLPVESIYAFLKTSPLPVWQAFLNRRFEWVQQIKTLLLFFREHSATDLDCHHLVLTQLLNAEAFNREDTIIRLDKPVLTNRWSYLFEPVTLQSYFLLKIATKKPESIINVSEIMLMILDINESDKYIDWNHIEPILKQRLEINANTPPNSHRQLVLKFLQNAACANRLSMSLKIERPSHGTERTDSMSNGPPSPV